MAQYRHARNVVQPLMDVKPMSFEYLLESSFSCDATWIHEHSNTKLPLHNFILESIPLFLKHFEFTTLSTVADVLNALKLIQVPSSVIREFWRIMYNCDNLFYDVQKQPTAKTIHSLICLVIVLRKLNIFDEDIQDHIVSFFDYGWSNREEDRKSYYRNLLSLCAQSNNNLQDSYLNQLMVTFLKSSLTINESESYTKYLSYFTTLMAELDLDAQAFSHIISFHSINRETRTVPCSNRVTPTWAPFDNGIATACLHYVQDIFGIKHCLDRNKIQPQYVYKAVLPTPNYRIKIRGLDCEYQVHDFIMIQWPYFGRMLKVPMEEVNTRCIELPEDFSHHALRVILAVLYGLDLNSSLQCGDLLTNMSKETQAFILQNAELYELVCKEDGENNAMRAEKVFQSLCEYCHSSTERNDLVLLFASSFKTDSIRDKLVRNPAEMEALKLFAKSFAETLDDRGVESANDFYDGRLMHAVITRIENN